jgi:hypothetical protein
MKIRFWKDVCAVALIATLGFAGTGWAASAGPFNFSDNQYDNNFTDVRRGADINDNNVPDLGGTGHTALNFIGGAGPAGDTWLTKYTPWGYTKNFKGWSGICIQGDVLIHTYNNTKGAGLVTLLNSDEEERSSAQDDGHPGKGLALILYDQGNSDALLLATIDPATGKLVKLKVVGLGAGIGNNAWYRVQMFVLAGAGYSDTLHVEATVFRHSTPTNPNSGTTTQVGGTLVFDGTLSGTGLESTGEVGIAASAFSTNVNSSVTNWSAQDWVGGCGCLEVECPILQK